MQTRTIYHVLVILMISGYLFCGLAQPNQSGLKTLTENADMIITGKVTQQSSSWNENKTKIYTSATIRVEENIKGSSQNTVFVIYPGGEVGDIGEMYSHSPRFENNEEVLVFLKKDLSGQNYKVLNGEEGKITVLTDVKTGEKITSHNSNLVSLKSQIREYIKD